MMTDTSKKTPMLFLAFDNLKKNPVETMVIAGELADTNKPFGLKFNLDSMLADRDFLSMVKMMQQFKRPVFADIKMWNGTRTMEEVVKTFVDLGVDFVNVYALADGQLKKAVKVTEGSNTKILGLTVLSHYDDAYCQKWFRRTFSKAVLDFSRFAVDAGCHGIILPGTSLKLVRELNIIKVATGLRPVWFKDSRHEQEATPADMVEGGADFAVCGSPILKQPTKEERIAAFLRILDEMEKSH